MSKFMFASAAAAVLMAFTPSAFAGDVSGQVDVLGSVAPSCSVTTALVGGINLNELARADGRLDTTKTGAAGPFTVMCNSSTPTIALSAQSLVGALNPPDPATYTNVVNYTAHLLVTETVSSETFNAASQNNASPATTTATLANPISGAANNVSVSVDTLSSNGGILTAGGYGSTGGGAGGLISITIAPN